MQQAQNAEAETERAAEEARRSEALRPPEVKLRIPKKHRDRDLVVQVRMQPTCFVCHKHTAPLWQPAICTDERHPEVSDPNMTQFHSSLFALAATILQLDASGHRALR